jgi:hypothetical protein
MPLADALLDHPASDSATKRNPHAIRAAGEGIIRGGISGIPGADWRLIVRKSPLSAILPGFPVSGKAEKAKPGSASC